MQIYRDFLTKKQAIKQQNATHACVCARKIVFLHDNFILTPFF
jgi:hypothetical protein